MVLSSWFWQVKMTAEEFEEWYLDKPSSSILSVAIIVEYAS